MCPNHQRIEKAACEPVNPAVLAQAIAAQEQKESAVGGGRMQLPEPPLPVTPTRAQLSATLEDVKIITPQSPKPQTQVAVLQPPPVPVSTTPTAPVISTPQTKQIPPATRTVPPAQPAKTIPAKTPQIPSARAHVELKGNTSKPAKKEIAPQPQAIPERQRTDTKTKVSVLLEKLAYEEKQVNARRGKPDTIRSVRAQFQNRALDQIRELLNSVKELGYVGSDKEDILQSIERLEGDARGSLISHMPEFMKD